MINKCKSCGVIFNGEILDEKPFEYNKKFYCLRCLELVKKNKLIQIRKSTYKVSSIEDDISPNIKNCQKCNITFLGRVRKKYKDKILCKWCYNQMFTDIKRTQKRLNKKPLKD
jgi:hypothetical protein